MSVFAHALLISGAAIGPGSRRPAQTSHTFNVTLAPIVIPVEDSGTATASQPESATRESDSPRTVETLSPAPKHATPKTGAQSPQRVSAPGAQAGIEQNVRPGPPSPRPGEGITHSPDTTYYTIRQLDIYPVPAEPLRLGSGSHAAPRDAPAVVELHISESGRVDAAKVIEAHQRGDFENELAATFLAIRFTPAVRDGRPVRSRVLVRIE